MTDKYDHRDTYRIRLILSAISLVLFLIILYLMEIGWTLPYDESFGAAVRALRGPVQNEILITITKMGAWPFLVTIGILIILADIISWRKIDYPLAVGACVLDLGLYAVLKRTIQRARPDEALWLLTEHGYSFPSGHTMNSVFCYGMMLYLVRRYVKNETWRDVMTVILAALPVMIGFTRIYCGVHYLSDVLGAAAMGFSMLMLFTVVLDETLLRLNQTT